MFLLLGFVVSAHHAGKRIAVGDADGGKPEFIGARHHFLRMRGAAQEGKIGGDGQFGVGVHRIAHANSLHANNPCTNQRAVAVSRP